MSTSVFADLVPKRLREQWAVAGIYPNKSVFEVFQYRATQHPNRVAVISDGLETTYSELLTSSLKLAAGLRNAGIGLGDVVAYQLPNSWRCCAIDLAVAALGGVTLPLPAGRGKLDTEASLRRSAARALVVSGEGDGSAFDEVDAIRPMLPSLDCRIALGGSTRKNWLSLELLFETPALSSNCLPVVSADAPFRITTTSGTESEPKLIAYSHNAMLGGRGRYLERINWGAEEFRCLYLVSLGSAAGANATAGILSWLGGSIVVMRKFDVQLAIATIEKSKPSHILGVPTMFQRMAAESSLRQTNRTSLRALISGGAGISPESISGCAEAFGCSFLPFYGSADGVICHAMQTDSADEPGHVGRPEPSICEIRIVDDSSITLPVGEVGEIYARGPITPMQYVNAPELDARYRDDEGWVRTGDMGRMSQDGYLYLTGRKKDVIIRGGANINPAQVEQLVTGMPGVVAAACVAVDDRDLGQRMCMVLTIRANHRRPSLEDVATYLRNRGLDSYKIPEYLRLVRDLPIAPTGKVDKRRLADEVAFLAT
ncbi:class I adenylate-forming enzyme family protein [Pandoraea pnomenusa]|uniref:class I adenylate-forming enzyme family protein n=1 Tax=Pandoraea pnomenusa TaxID=93220 RepID=UPI00333EAD32